MGRCCPVERCLQFGELAATTSCGGRIAAGILTTFINVQKTTTTNIIGLLVHPPFRERAVPYCNHAMLQRNRRRLSIGMSDAKPSMSPVARGERRPSSALGGVSGNGRPVHEVKVPNEFWAKK